MFTIILLAATLTPAESGDLSLAFKIALGEAPIAQPKQQGDCTCLSPKDRGCTCQGTCSCPQVSSKTVSSQWEWRRFPDGDETEVWLCRFPGTERSCQVGTFRFSDKVFRSFDPAAHSWGAYERPIIPAPASINDVKPLPKPIYQTMPQSNVRWVSPQQCRT